MTKQARCWLLMPLLLGSRAYADFSAQDRGTAAGQFLKLGAGARAEAMGEAYSAVADDASALYWNPAGLASVRGGSLTAMHAPYLVSSFYDYLACAQNLGPWGVLGLGGQFFSAGSIGQTDAVGNDLGNINPNDLAVSVGFAHALPWDMSLGISGKFVRSTLASTAQAQAADIGFLSPQFWQDRARLALTATNLGGRLRFDQEGESLPRALRAGGRLRLDSWLFSLDGVLPNDNGPYMAMGAEYGLAFSRETRGALRAGFNARDVGDLGAFAAVSFGMGLSFGNLSLDYALVPMGALGLSHRFSLSLGWGKAADHVHDEARQGWVGANVSVP